MGKEKLDLPSFLGHHDLGDIVLVWKDPSMGSSEGDSENSVPPPPYPYSSIFLRQFKATKIKWM